MGILILKSGEEEAKEFKLDHSRMVIGRRPSCDIHLNDSTVSGEHALLINILDDSFIENVSKTNGTWINGQRIKKSVLQDGDKIKIGGQRLVYQADQTMPGVDEDDFEKTMVLKPGQVARDVAKGSQVQAIRDAEDTAAMKAIDPTPSSKLARLKVRTGPAKGKETVIDRAMVTLGRPGVQVVVVSRRKDAYYVNFIAGASDAATKPTVNGKALQSRATKLADGDVINLVDVEIEFRL
jgi:pSer/pThr/pTyr-binding forkhead associated (FHA) protein